MTIATFAGEAAGHSPTPIVLPPSTTIVWPVMKVEAGEARKTAAPAISCGSPIRRIGVVRGDRLQRVGILPQRAGEIGPDQAGRDAVHAHPVRAELGGEVAGELEVGGLGDVVGADHRRAWSGRRSS